MDRIKKLTADIERQFNHPKLSVELVPSTSWYSNVRSNVTRRVWDKIRKDVYRNADYQCEVCHKVRKRRIECHEIWESDEN